MNVNDFRAELHKVASSRGLKIIQGGNDLFWTMVGTSDGKGTRSSIWGRTEDLTKEYYGMDTDAAIQLVAQPLERYNVWKVLVAHIKLNHINSQQEESHN